MTCGTLARPNAFDRTVAPTVEPISLALAQEMIRKPINPSDVETPFMLAAARSRAEGYLERAILEQTWVAYLDDFWGGAELELPRPSLREVVSVEYLADETDVWTTVATSVYEVNTVHKPGRVRLKPGQYWPTPYARPDAVRLTFKAGYGAAASAVPECVKEAILLLLGHYDRNREAVLTGTISNELPEGVKALLDLERIPWTGD